MNNNTVLQESLFSQIKSILPSHLNLVDEIAELLQISNDSAYRRLRGDKQLTLEELVKICHHFRISMDNLFDIRLNTVTFNTYTPREDSLLMKDYLGNILRDFEKIDKKLLEEVIIVFNELHFFQFIQIPEIAIFKLFFWRKTTLGFSEFRDRLFSLEQPDEENLALCRKIAELYCSTPTREVLTSEAIASFVKQIIFYEESGFFKRPEEAGILCNKLLEMVAHFQLQAELGYKFPFGQEPLNRGGSLDLYYNDVALIDNSIIANMGGTGITYLTYNAMNLMYTSNTGFYERTFEWAQNLIRKSVLISGSAERERNRFFLSIRKRIEDLKSRC